jgi:hypothetical protein
MFLLMIAGFIYFFSSEMALEYSFFFPFFVRKALFDLENTNQELRSDLRDLFINSAK